MRGKLSQKNLKIVDSKIRNIIIFSLTYGKGLEVVPFSRRIFDYVKRLFHKAKDDAAVYLIIASLGLLSAWASSFFDVAPLEYLQKVIENMRTKEL